jgi:hypothetical protein
VCSNGLRVTAPEIRNDSAVDEDANAAPAAVRQRARRIGFFYFAISPGVAALFAWLSSTVTYGVLFGALCFALGLYIAFVYVPFAVWLRRWEQSRGQ